MEHRSKQFDVVIVGGGPAGMAAVLWCDELGLSSCLLERSGALGGQLGWIHNPIRNYLGVDFANGEECLSRFSKSLENRKFELYSKVNVGAINAETKELVTSQGAFFYGALIVATGIRRRELDVPGEMEFRGRGIFASGSRDRHDVRGREVAVIGGGDAALENSLILAEFASKVYLIHRRDRFSARDEFVEAVEANQKIEVLFNTEADRFGGDCELEFIEIRMKDRPRRTLQITKAVIRIGVIPNSKLLSGIADLDGEGYIKVDRFGRSSSNAIYAVGDVANHVSPTIASAVGSAATAVKAIAKFARDLE